MQKRIEGAYYPIVGVSKTHLCQECREVAVSDEMAVCNKCYQSRWGRTALSE